MSDSVDTAWSLLRQALSARTEEEVKARLTALDERLATFVRSSPGALESVLLSDLLIPLIRRACFFEGAVENRIDPERAVRVLGLK